MPTTSKQDSHQGADGEDGHQEEPRDVVAEMAGMVVEAEWIARMHEVRLQVEDQQAKLRGQ